MRIRNLALSAMTAASIAGFAAAPSMAATTIPTPVKSVCSTDSYACLSVNQTSIPAGQTVIFKGSLSKVAMKNLASWTMKDNIVCLTRYAAKPLADGGWPSTTLEGACAQVNKAGKFTINAELGKTGFHYFGVEMGPCQADAAQCGNSDGGLVGLDRTSAVGLTTT